MKPDKNDKTLQCKICDKMFTQIYSLVLHIGAHTKNKPYKCDVCGQKFDWYDHLKTHRKQTSCFNFKCNICLKNFARKATLAFHQKAHGQKPFSCKICRKDFTNNDSLSLHAAVHTRKTANTVPQCKKGIIASVSFTDDQRIYTGE